MTVFQELTKGMKFSESTEDSPPKSDFLTCAPIVLTSGLFQKLANTQENPSRHINGNGMSS